MDDDLIRELAEDIHCGVPLTRDLLMLAGGNAQLVRDASDACYGINSVKAYILDHRIAKIEE